MDLRCGAYLMSSKFSVSGFDGLDKALAKLSGGVHEGKLRALLHEGGEIIAKEARRLAPVDTGTLPLFVDEQRTDPASRCPLPV